MKIHEVSACLEKLAPLAFQEDYDNSGLLIGDPGAEVAGILITLDVTPEVLEEAAKKKCNLIISHHPVIFKGLKKLTGGHFTERIAVEAIRKRIALYAIHTNLDNVHDSHNRVLISELGVKDPKILAPVRGALSKLVTFCPTDHADRVRQALFEAGAGHIGNYDACSFNAQGKGTFRASDQANPFVGEKNMLHVENEMRIEVIFPSFLGDQLVKALLGAHPYEEVAYDIYPLANSFGRAGAGMVGDLEEPVGEMEFLDRVKKTVGIPYLRHTRLPGKLIRRVAACGGSGAFLIRDARKAGADIFLTGDLKYHDFFEAQDDIIVADIGHYESEQFAREWIYNVLTEKFPNFALLISEISSNPVKYH
jgi:dinuclear metal center YbgI/SA1388 family protein